MPQNACKTRFSKQLGRLSKVAEIPVNPRELPSAGVGYTCSFDYTFRNIVLPLQPLSECTSVRRLLAHLAPGSQCTSRSSAPVDKLPDFAHSAEMRLASHALQIRGRDPETA